MIRTETTNRDAIDCDELTAMQEPDDMFHQNSVNTIRSDLDSTEQSKNNRIFLYIAATIANLSALTCGLAIGWTSPELPILKTNSTTLDHIIDADEESWIGSLMPAGAVFGPFLIGVLLDRIGRKKSLLIAIVPLIVAFLLAAYATQVVYMYMMRFLCGFGIGAVFTVLPIYIGEISDDHVRGALGSFMQLFLTIGMVIAFSIGPYTSVHIFNLICTTFPLGFLLLFTIYIPDSPYYTFKKNPRLAEKHLARFRNTDSNVKLQEELKQIQKSYRETEMTFHLMDLFKSRVLLKCLSISIGLVVFQQLSGINVVLFYAQDIFTDAGSTLNPEIATIIIGIVQMVASGVTPNIVERYGKRFLLLLSALGMVVSQGLLSLYFYLQKHHLVSGITWLPIICLISYIIVYCLGFGPLPWAVLGELFPVKAKSKASTITASTCWFFGFLLTKYFNFISQLIGTSGSFLIFTIFCVVAYIFVYKYLPETSGKSPEEIQTIIQNN